ncbi:MAG TPA: hypothetical protein PLU50_07520, partial [Pseudobdellovibrionaceae bacterium]|nr:hypothetical protein [Pseudobdellovibrionaceae bacterium]
MARLILFSAGVGLLWFGVESGFVLVIQGFFVATGLVSPAQSLVPGWYPSSMIGGTLVFLAVALLRLSVSVIKSFLAARINVLFMVRSRISILQLCLKEPQMISQKEAHALFSDVIAQSGAVIFNVSSLLVTGIASVFFFGLGFRLAPLEMILGLVILSFFVIPLKLSQKRMQIYGEGIFQEWQGVNGILLRGIKNQFLLKLYQEVGSEINKAREALDRYQHHHLRYSVMTSLLGGLPIFVGMSVIAVVTHVSIIYIHTEPLRLVSFFYIFLRLAQATSEMSSTISSIRVNLPGLKKLYNTNINAYMHTLSKKELQKIEGNQISIEVKNMDF